MANKIHNIAKPKFRTGQKVYIPWLNDGEIATLQSDCNCSLFAETKKGVQSFDEHGISNGSPTQPDLFLATRENYDLLSKLMPWVDFELPKKPNTLKMAQPKYVYELRMIGYEGYHQMLVSLDKSLLEKFIERVREHDHKYLKESRENDEFDYEDMDEEHPLAKWMDDIFGWNGSEADLYDDLDDMEGESWANSLEIAEIEVFYG